MNDFDTTKGMVSPYESLFVFCSMEFLRAWKGSRHLESGFFCAAIFAYWHEDFLPRHRDTYFYNLPETPEYFFWYLPKRLPEYFYRFSDFEWALFHEKPLGFDDYAIDLQQFAKTKNTTAIKIGNTGAVLFPAWMTGEDIVHYSFGLHKYTKNQNWYDLVFLDLPQGTYDVYTLFEGIKPDIEAGFIMSKK